MDPACEGRPGNPRLLVAVALQASGLVSVLPVFLFHRVEIAQRLSLLGAIASEAVTFGIVTLVAGVLVCTVRDKIPAGMLCVLGGFVATAGLVTMTITTEATPFVVAGVLVAIGSAPALVLQRILLSTDKRFADRFRTFSWLWAALALGTAMPLVLSVFGIDQFTTHLRFSAVLTCIGTIFLVPHLLAHDEDIEVEATVARIDVVWVRRANGFAFAFGGLLVGSAAVAQSLLVDEWQRSETQTAAILAGGLLAGALISVFGPWYHRLTRLSGGRRADVVGTNCLVAGALVTLGALSFTYIGLIACWLVAGGALALAATSLDATLFATIAPHLRRKVAFGQLVRAGVGAGLVLIVNARLIGGVSDQFKIAWVGLLLVVVGAVMRRFSPSARDTNTIVAQGQATTALRRVVDINTPNTPLLSVEEVSVAYGSVQVLFEVDLQVGEGAVVALLGTNGAGKTTLLRTISGLEPTIAGRIVYAGLDITKTRPTWRTSMGLHQIVGGETVVGTLTVAENLRLFGHGLARSAKAEAQTTTYQLVYELFPRLADRANQRADTLSGGEKQMLSLSKAIIAPPRLLLIDEFSLGLAPTVIADLLPVIRAIAERGAAVLLVEQSVNIALAIADYAYVIEKGAIGYSGTSAELAAKPNLLQAAYLEGLSSALRSTSGVV